MGQTPLVCCFPSADDQPGNQLASVLLRRPVRGVAVFLSVRRGNHLYALLRPELVASNRLPLSSDAFTGFGVHGAAVHNQEVRDATRRLHEELIPRFADDIAKQRLVTFNGQHLSTLLHERGVLCCPVLVLGKARVRVWCALHETSCVGKHGLVVVPTTHRYQCTAHGQAVSVFRRRNAA